jgi:hypothetical protein
MLKTILFLSVLSSVAVAAPELEEENVKPEMIRTTVGLYDNDDTGVDVAVQYGSNTELRDEKKVGLGSQVGGGLGVFGLNLEVNIDERNSAVAGVGMGPGYGSFQVLWKHNWEGKYFTPYASAGWSRWYDSGNSGDSGGSSILNLVLNEKQKSSGRFLVDFVNAAAGMQYQQLSGDFAGMSFFAEFGMMSAFQDLTPILTGALGAIYYF